VDKQPNDAEQLSPKQGKGGAYSRDSTLALELPFTLVGAVVFGGILGYLLDHWLHTRWIFTLILGGLGFAGGVREVIRRLP
jgi:F0F1-type ATP synthase assembly protein I